MPVSKQASLCRQSSLGEVPRSEPDWRTRSGRQVHSERWARTRAPFSQWSPEIGRTITLWGQKEGARYAENHNHLFFLNHHTVNPVASAVIPIAISYPYSHLTSGIP